MPRAKKISSSSRFAVIKDRVTGFFGGFRNRTYPAVKAFIVRRPMVSFFVALGILLLLIIANSLLTPKPQEISGSEKVKEVKIYKIGSAPKISVAASVQKKGVVQIIAQAPGIVNSVNVNPGQTVSRGTVLVNLANNYTGGSAAGVSAAIANAQYKNVKETYDTQLDIINKQREIANQTEENTSELRNITDQSVSDTHNLIDLNASVIVTLEQNLQNLEQNNVNGANDATILSTKQLLTQARSTNNQLYQAVRNAEYQSNSDNPPAKLSELSKDVTLKQLDVQEKALDLSKEVSRLQSALAYISASSMAPASPFNGIVERVNVVPGQTVNPGMVLATVTSSDQEATVIAKVPSQIAQNISKVESSSLFINGKTYEVVPTYISTEATDGLLYSVVYAVPDELVGKLTDRDFIQVDIPIGYPDSISAVPYLPIDIIYETQSGSYVYLLENGKAVSRKVTLGEVVGGNVAINEGLADKDQVILDRNVIEGDKVKASK